MGSNEGMNRIESSIDHLEESNEWIESTIECENNHRYKVWPIELIKKKELWMPIYYRKPGREDEEEEKKMASIICSKINYGTVVTKNKKNTVQYVHMHACSSMKYYRNLLEEFYVL